MSPRILTQIVVSCGQCRVRIRDPFSPHDWCNLEGCVIRMDRKKPGFPSFCPLGEVPVRDLVILGCAIG